MISFNIDAFKIKILTFILGWTDRTKEKNPQNRHEKECEKTTDQFGAPIFHHMCFKGNWSY